MKMNRQKLAGLVLTAAGLGGVPAVLTVAPTDVKAQGCCGSGTGAPVQQQNVTVGGSDSGRVGVVLGGGGGAAPVNTKCGGRTHNFIFGLYATSAPGTEECLAAEAALAHVDSQDPSERAVAFRVFGKSFPNFYGKALNDHYKMAEICFTGKGPGYIPPVPAVAAVPAVTRTDKIEVITKTTIDGKVTEKKEVKDNVVVVTPAVPAQAAQKEVLGSARGLNPNAVFQASNNPAIACDQLTLVERARATEAAAMAARPVVAAPSVTQEQVKQAVADALRNQPPALPPATPPLTPADVQRMIDASRVVVTPPAQRARAAQSFVEACGVRVSIVGTGKDKKKPTVDQVNAARTAAVAAARAQGFECP